MATPEFTIDQYLQQSTFGDDPFGGFVQRSRDAGLPEIQVSVVFGRALELFTRLTNARLVIEVGTLGGYSAAWMARALPEDGRVITLEIDPHHAEVARANLASVALDHKVDVRVGPALDTLLELRHDPLVAGHMDFAFIDADKSNNPNYVAQVVELARPGALIIVDNVVRSGTVLDADSNDPNTVGTRAVLAMLGSNPRLSATALQTVGLKGHDGFAMAFVNH